MIVSKYFTLYTDHGVVANMQGLSGWDPPRPSHGVVEVIPRDRASSIRVIAISRSGRSGGLIPVDVLLKIWGHQKSLLSERRISGSYGRIILCIVGWRHPLGKARGRRVVLMRSQSAMSTRLRKDPHDSGR